MSETSHFTTDTLEAFIHAFGLDREITRTVLTEVDIDIDDRDNLRTLLNELHIPLLNINPAVFNTEWVTKLAVIVRVLSTGFAWIQDNFATGVS